MRFVREEGPEPCGKQRGSGPYCGMRRNGALSDV